MGANDLCGWAGTMTPTAPFRAQFTETLEILRAGLPASHVFVASIPNLYQLNSVLRDVCATWSNCRFDNYLTYNYDFTRSMVSKLDYFHPSLSGQGTLAALTWNASWWG